MSNKSKEEIRKLFHEIVVPKIVWGKPLTQLDRDLRIQWIKECNGNVDYLNFYTNKNILFEIVKYLGNKELCFDSKIRWLYASKVNYLLFDLFFYKVLEEPKTFYTGLADFGERPHPPFNPIEKRAWQEEFWTRAQNPEYIKRMVGYDFGIDLDAETFEKSYKDANKVFDLFNSYKIRFSVWCSGKKGFHFIVPYEEFKDLFVFSPENCTTFCLALALDIKDKLKLTKMDTVIYTSSRFLKCPYTLDIRNNRVIYPLDDQEFINFNDDYMSMDYVLSKKNLGFRGAYLNRFSNPEGFKKMVNEL